MSVYSSEENNFFNSESSFSSRTPFGAIEEIIKRQAEERAALRTRLGYGDKNSLREQALAAEREKNRSTPTVPVGKEEVRSLP
ncbi:hypothetical protein, partial [Streptomyces bauhiniae]